MKNIVKERQIKKMLSYFQHMDFTDIIAFGNILGVQEVDDFAEYVTNILVAFEKVDAKKRVQLMKLAKDVVEANEEIDKTKAKTETEVSKEPT